MSRPQFAFVIEKFPTREDDGNFVAKNGEYPFFLIGAG